MPVSFVQEEREYSVVGLGKQGCDKVLTKFSTGGRLMPLLCELRQHIDDTNVGKHLTYIIM